MFIFHVYIKNIDMNSIIFRKFYILLLYFLINSIIHHSTKVYSCVLLKTAAYRNTVADPEETGSSCRGESHTLQVT